jgi:hypothetical protein
MQTVINISLNVPPAYQVDKLVQQLTDYRNWLVVNKTQSNSGGTQYRFKSLRGLKKGIKASSEELIREYLKEKYDV